jgi:hypothetical protein
MSSVIALVGIVYFAIIGFKIMGDLSLTPEQKLAKKQKLAKELIIKDFGTINSKLICPHCQTEGFVHTKSVALKKGVSGAKATGAVLTGGLSLLATGLSRKEDNTQAHCENCNSTWFF